jgi:hypothetical protein
MDEGGLRETHICFLLGDFDEKEWGRRLARAEKKKKRDTEIQEVFAAFRMVGVELLNRIQNYREGAYDAFTLLPSYKANAYLEEWNKEVQELVVLTNEGLKAIGLSYDCHVPYITTDGKAGHGRFFYRVLRRKMMMGQKRATGTKGKTVEEDEGDEEGEEEEEEYNDAEEEKENGMVTEDVVMTEADTESDKNKERDESDEDTIDYVLQVVMARSLMDK